MRQKYLSDAKTMAREAGYHDARKVGEWDGYEIIEPIFTDGQSHFIGLPQYILYRDGKLRWAKDTQESFSIMDALAKDKSIVG